MRKLWCLGFVCLVVVGLLGSGSVTAAQEVSASITGTIVDQSGAAVTGATVSAKDTERGTTFTAVTNDSGIYNLLRVPVGTYTLRVEAKGFSTAVREAFVLVLNQTARIDVQLKVGDVSATVEVSGDAPILKTDSTQVDTVINSATNDALPLATRNYVELTLLAPGSVTVNPDGFNSGNNTDFGGERPYINGNRDQSNNFLLDGMDNNQVSDNLLGYTPAPDAIQEFNLITSNAPAEFGNFEGGIVSATIKSGTNSYHGDAWEFFRNDKLNANSWSNNFNGNPKDKLRWNMFGGTFGGPIFKNKLFFFADYQGQRFDHPSSTQTTTVFTDAERAGDFSAAGVTIYNPCETGTSVTAGNCVAPAPDAQRTPFAGNKITDPNAISPVAQALFNSPLYLPTINGNLTNNAQYTTVSNLNADQGDLKIDYQVSDKDRISGRFTRAFFNFPTTNSFLLLGNSFSQAPIYNITGDWSHNLTPSISNDFRMGWSHITTNSGTTFDPAVGAFGNALGIGNGNPANVDGLLALQVGGSIADVGAGESTASFDDHVWQFEDSVSVTRGRHNFKFGGQYLKQVIKTFYAGNSGELGHLIFSNDFTASSALGTELNPPTGGFGPADFYLGLPSELNRGNSTGQTWQQSSNVFGFYAQDNWRITDRLTLNLGLRYDVHTPWVEEHDQQVNIQLGTGAVLFAGKDGNSRALYNGVYGGKAFQPRIGFAWTPEILGGHTVVRGAFTISSYMEGTGTNLRLPLNPPFTPAEFDITYKGLATPGRTSTDGIPTVPAPTLDCPNFECFAGALLRIWDPNVQPAIADQWNLTIQRQFLKDMTFQIGYVGQRGTHLMVPFDYAQPVLNPGGAPLPSPFLAGNPQLASIASDQASGTQSNGTMSYNSLQAVLQKQMGNGLQFQVAYTYSKCMSDSTGYYGAWVRTGSASAYWQNAYDSKDEWAPCYYDATHVVSTYVLYELPLGKGKRFGKDMNKFADAAVGGWSVAGIMTGSKGFPLSIFGANDVSGVDSRGFRPDCVGKGTVTGKTPSTIANGFQWLNFADANTVFTQPGAQTFGTCAPQLGYLRGPGYIDFDLSLQKDFHLTERFKLQFRSDFLNAFNHVNLNGPDTSINSPTFGLINGAQSPRNIQFALKLYY